MNQQTTSIIIAGVGGQGVLLAAGLLSEAALAAGFDVKSSEVHGMAQRGGSVLSQVRFGKKVYSPLTPAGTGDYLIALEELEALRYRKMLKRRAWIFLQGKRILPAPVLAGSAVYPEGVEDTLVGEGYRVAAVPASEVVSRFGNGRPANVCLLGMLSARLPFPAGLWRKVLDRSIRKELRAVNRQAFQLGREFILSANRKEGHRG